MKEKVWKWEFDPLAQLNEDDVRITRHGFSIAKTSSLDNAQRLCNMLNFAEENMNEEEINNGYRRGTINQEVVE